MKLLALSNVFARPWDRTRGTYNQIIFDQLSARFETTLLVPVSWVDYLKRPRAAFNANKDGAKLWPYTVYFPYFYIPGLTHAINSVFLFISLLISCPRLIFLNKWDCLLGSWLFPDATAISWLGSILRRPVIAVALGSDANVLLTKPLQRLQIRSALNHCQYVISVSQALSEKIRDAGIDARRLKVVYNGVDSTSFKPVDREFARSELGIANKGKVILFVGYLIRAKGCHELIKAFKLLYDKPENANLQLIYVGDGPERGALTQLAVELGISKAVNFVGSVLHKDLPEWFASADIFCLPSYQEGVPNVVMEAMSTGLPIVATHVGGIPEVVPGFAGRLIPPREVDALANALESELSSTRSATDIRAHVARFTWERTCDEYSALIVESAGSSRHP